MERFSIYIIYMANTAKAVEVFLKPYLKTNVPDIRPGDTVRVHQRIKDVVPSKKGKKAPKEERERIQVFEGVVLARKHGRGLSATITVRRIISGVGVERIFPLHSPTIEKIEIVGRAKVRRAKLYYLRERRGKKAKLKRKQDFQALVYKEGEEKKEAAPAKEGETETGETETGETGKEEQKEEIKKEQEGKTEEKKDERGAEGTVKEKGGGEKKEETAK